MSYQRVIPRDLFNEANLLKCYGRLWILLEPRLERSVRFELDGEEFVIDQRASDGNLYIDNLRLWIRGQMYNLFRPLNSRDQWPLYLSLGWDEDDIRVFTDEGELSEEMLALLETHG